MANKKETCSLFRDKKRTTSLMVMLLFGLSFEPIYATNATSGINVSNTVQQTNKVSGNIVDNNGEPIIGASVIVKGATHTGTITDVDGNFTLNAPAKSILIISYVGYKTQEVQVGNLKSIKVILVEDAETLEEVVVIGYGTRTKKDVTTSISNIGSDVIGKTLSMSAESAMQGMMSGVQVSGVSGDPMARPTIRIRGTNSWGVSDPLYVIDGIAITEMGAGIEGQENDRIGDMRGPINIMSMIDPSDIESISVLKDASAAAIYGVRAANGVVLITTKKGRVDKPTVDLSMRYGIQNITQGLNWLTTPQYVKFVNDMFATNPDAEIAIDNVGLFDVNSPKYLGNSKTYDWQDAVRNKNAATQDYSVKVSGGTENTDYYISLGYSDSKGVLLVNDLSRYSGAVKLNTKINDYLKTGINYRIVSAKGQNVYTGDDYFALSRTAPWQPIYEEPGVLGYNGYAFVVPGYNTEDGSYSQAKMYGTGSRANMLGIANTNTNKYNSLRNMGSAYIELTPVKGLRIRGTVSLDLYRTDRTKFDDYSAYPFSYVNGDPSSLGGGKSAGNYNERTTTNKNITEEFLVNYTTSFKKHNIDFLFNFSNQHYDAKYVEAGSQYVSSKKDYLWKLEGANEYTNVFSDNMRWALQGYLFRIGYNYNHRYYFDATVRHDGSARFSPENRWGTFPSFSAAWRIKSESFMENLLWIDDLKLRTGWGQLGNQEVRDMAYLSVISQAPSYAFGTKGTGVGNYTQGATIFGIPNRDLTWEKTETFNIGFDAQLFQGLDISAEYYYKKTKGILQVVDIPLSLGVKENPVANVAEVQNQGIEISATYRGQVGKLNYSIGGNISTTANEVLKTYKGIPTSGGTVEEGHSMFYYKAYKVAGIFQTDEEAKEWMNAHEDVGYQKSKVKAGDFYFQDLRKAPEKAGEFYAEGADGKIDAYDMVEIGKSIPGYFYGFNLNAEYKGFDFSAQFSGVGDVLKYNSIKAQTFYPTQGDNMTDIVYKAWSPDNKQNKYPRLVMGDPAGNLRYSDFFFESGAYLRLQNVQIGYTLPKSFYAFCKHAIRNVRVYVGASNLFTITGYSGLDPENDTYPAPKVFFMGLNAKF